MKRRLIAILGAATLVAPAAAQEVLRFNQDIGQRPKPPSEQTVSDHASAPGGNVQKPQPAAKSWRRGRPARASKAPPRLPGPPPNGRTP